MESRLSLIVRVNVVLTRTVAVDSDWRFDNLCGCHLQKEYVHPDDQTQPTFEMTPGFKPFTVLLCSGYANALFTGKRFILWIVSSTFGPTGTWTAKQAIYNCRPERLRSELNYLTANQFICTERPHKEWYSMFICLVQRLNCMWQIFYLLDESTSGLSLRFQVAGYVLLVAGEVTSSHGDPPTPKKFLKCNFYRFPKGIPAPKKQSSSRVQLSLAGLWWSRFY